jgi:dTMP kinase
VGVAQGIFVVFEGGDGAGKTTQLRLLADALRARGGREAVVTREPGGTALGAQLRAALLHGGDVDPRAEALLYAADRAQHVAEVIRPALARGAIVLSDRYLDSSIAYQADGRALGEDAVRAANRLATGGLEPDLTVLLDIEPAAAAARLAAAPGSADRIEAAGPDFHAAVNARFRELAGRDPRRYAVLDAARPATELHAEVLAAVLAAPARREGEGP